MLRQILLPVAGCLVSLTGITQVSAVRLTVHTPPVPNKNVYVAGSFNRWTAGDSLYKMKKLNDSTYTIVLPVFKNTVYKYKYTLGSWNEVETDLNDSSISNRSFVSAKKKIKITDAVQKWQTQKPASQQANPHMARINAMKDSLAEGLKPKLNDMLVLLKEYIINMLQEKPSEAVDKRITANIVNHFAEVYGKINGLCHKIFEELTPQQKQQILKAVKTPEGDKDIINTFIAALGEATKGNVKTP